MQYLKCFFGMFVVGIGKCSLQYLELSLVVVKKFCVGIFCRL